MDNEALKRKLPLKELFEAEGVKVGVYHAMAEAAMLWQCAGAI